MFIYRTPRASIFYDRRSFLFIGGELMAALASIGGFDFPEPYNTQLRFNKNNVHLS